MDVEDEGERYKDRDYLIPLNDPWEAQTSILVLKEHGRFRFYRHGEDSAAVADLAPDPASVFIAPARHSTEFELVLRGENLLASAIERGSSKLTLEGAIELLGTIGLKGQEAEGILRFLISRGDFVAKSSGTRGKKITLSLSHRGRAREGHRSFASSFAHELAVQSEQIGRLIGHGPTLGSEREELLRALLERHVPRRFHVATGFIEGLPRQLDILIYDQVDYAPLFRAGNLVVVPPEAVRALIEVKSTLDSSELADALTQLSGPHWINDHPPIFRGIFAYSGTNAGTLINALIHHHRYATDFEEGGLPVFSVDDMITCVCVLRKTFLLPTFRQTGRKDDMLFEPVIQEIASEAGRGTEAALFFDRLLRFLRHPFEGSLQQRGYVSRFAADAKTLRIDPLYPDTRWGPYMIDVAIDRVEGEISALSAWLQGVAWHPPTKR
jgi:hypothetical protein